MKRSKGAKRIITKTSREIERAIVKGSKWTAIAIKKIVVPKIIVVAIIKVSYYPTPFFCSPYIT